MTDKTLVSQYDGTLVKVGEQFVRVDKGGAVPPGADEAHVKVLENRGMVKEGEVSAGFVTDPDTPAPFQVAEGSSDVPAKSANKDAWVEFAVSQGASREDAEAATKDDLIASYGG